MKTFLDCIPCFMSQALRAARLATDDEFVIKDVLDEIAALIQAMPMDRTPPEMGETVYALVSEKTGNRDPFREIKRKNIQKAHELYGYFGEWMDKQPDPFKAAVMLSIAGNVIDLGIKGNIDIKKR